MILVLLTIPLGAAAQPAQWHYCLAIADPIHTAYLSAPVWSGRSTEELEESYRARLAREGLSYSSVQCPRAADEVAMRAMMRSTIAFSRMRDRQIMHIDWNP